MPYLRYTISQKVINFLVTRLLVTINIGWVILALLNRSVAINLTREDNVIQWFQFFFLLATAFYCLRIVRGHGIFYKERIIANGFIVFFVLTLLLAFEEISWGQRFFDIPTPDFIKQINVQNEITLHNLGYFQRCRHWLLILFGCAGLVLIHLRTHGYKIDVQLLLFLPPAFFKTAFILILISGFALEVAYLFKLLSPGDMANAARFWAGRFSEIGETGVSITAFSYASDRFNSIFSRKRSLNKVLR